MRTLVAGIALASCVLVSAESDACSCLPPGSVLEELGEAAAVFSGRVIAIADDAEGTGIRARVRVYERWKGASAGYVTVETEGNTAACGYPLEPGEYLFYAYERTGNRYRLSLCSRTARLSEASEDLEILRGTVRP